jgi:hypothetical protein
VEGGEDGMRDRLIELLGDFPVWHSTLKENWMPEAVERLADHLLAAGVLVPPAKVGSDVYVIDGGVILRRTLGRLIYDCGDGFVGFWGETLFGKTVFLTCEEAEAEMERRNHRDAD